MSGGNLSGGNLVTTVITKIVKGAAAEAARDALSAGTFPVDFVLKVTGEVTIRPDTVKVPTVSIPLKEVIALFLARSGALRAQNIALLSECITDALLAKSSGEGGATGALTSEFDKAFGEVVDNFLATLPKTKVRGAVDVKGLSVNITDNLSGE